MIEVLQHNQVSEIQKDVSSNPSNAPPNHLRLVYPSSCVSVFICVMDRNVCHFQSGLQDESQVESFVEPSSVWLCPSFSNSSPTSL